jgi:hypothetical protein
VLVPWQNRRSQRGREGGPAPARRRTKPWLGLALTSCNKNEYYGRVSSGPAVCDDLNYGTGARGDETPITAYRRLSTREVCRPDRPSKRWSGVQQWCTG